MLRELVLLVLLIVVLHARPTGASIYCMEGSKWGGIKCQCQPGMVNLNGRCVCDYGYTLGTNGCQRCVMDSTGRNCRRSSSVCPPEMLWNGYMCTFNWKVSNCGTNGYWNGAACCKWSYPIICEAGFTWNGQACILFAAASCPSGQFWNGQQCWSLRGVPSCPSPFVWDGQTNSCINSQPEVCDAQNVWIGNGCVSITSPVRCNPGNYFNGETCVTIASTILPLCADGYLWTGKLCKQTTTQACDAGCYYDVQAGSCFLKFCQTNYAYSTASSTCVSISPSGNRVNLVTPTTSISAPAAGSGPINIVLNGPMGATTVSVNGGSTTITQPSPIFSFPSSVFNMGSLGINTSSGITTTNSGLTTMSSPPPATSISQGGVAVASPGTTSTAPAGTTVVNGGNAVASAPASLASASATVNSNSQASVVAPASAPSTPTPEPAPALAPTPAPQTNLERATVSALPPTSPTRNKPTSNFAQGGNVAVGGGRRTMNSRGSSGSDAIAVGGSSYSSGNGMAIGGAGIGSSGGSIIVSPGTTSTSSVSDTLTSNQLRASILNSFAGLNAGSMGIDTSYFTDCTEANC